VVSTPKPETIRDEDSEDMRGETAKDYSVTNTMRIDLSDLGF
jgi:hypothetical protein